MSSTTATNTSYNFYYDNNVLTHYSYHQLVKEPQQPQQQYYNYYYQQPQQPQQAQAQQYDTHYNNYGNTGADHIIYPTISLESAETISHHDKYYHYNNNNQLPMIKLEEGDRKSVV